MRYRSVLLFVAVVAFLATAGPAFAREAPAEGVDAALNGLIVKAFRAAMADDFDAYLETIHPDSRDTSTQRTSIERYSWARFKRQTSWYLTDDSDPKTYEVVRKDGSETQPRWFIKDQDHSDRMPVPVRFMQHNSEWYIYTNSL